MKRFGFAILLFLIASSLHAQNSGYVTYNFGLDILSPVGTYKNFTSRSFVGGHLGFLMTTKSPGLSLGGHVGYGLQDQFNAYYFGPSPIGIETEYEESLYNTNVSIAMDGRYMPYLFDLFQPYVGASFGIRRIATYLVTTDIIDNVNAGNQVFKRAWTMQIGASLGIIVPLNNGFLLDVGVQYLETQAAAHLIRKTDWRSIDPFFSTDIYDEVRTGIKHMGARISIIYTP